MLQKIEWKFEVTIHSIKSLSRNVSLNKKITQKFSIIQRSLCSTFSSALLCSREESFSQKKLFSLFHLSQRSGLFLHLSVRMKMHRIENERKFFNLNITG